ncbi:MAG: hypothetical protein Kow001_12880 [Acidobacteriota bacterium]
MEKSRSRRRVVFRLFLILLFSGGILVFSGLLLWGGREMPVELWEKARSDRSRLLEAQADRFLPDRFAAFETRHGSLREQFYRLSAENALLRDLEPFEAALRQHLQDAEVLFGETIRLRDQMVEQQTMEIEALARLLEPDAPRILIPAYRKERSDFQMRLGQARELLAQKEVFRVAELLDRLKESSAVVKSYLDDLESRFSDPGLLRHWEDLCDRAYGLSRSGGRVLLVDKYRRRSYVLERGRIIRTFPVELGWNGLRDKLQQGDGATPEGEYKVTRKKGNGDTRYYKALLLNYPNDADRVAFRKALRQGKVNRRARIGGLIEIHGDGGRGQDWTDGCVALENGDMDTLFELAYVGMPVIVVGKCPKNH